MANKINEILLEKISGETKTYKSIDTCYDENLSLKFPTEFLNCIEQSGLPYHKLKLKVGCPIICLRNLAPPKLCNGVRLIITKLDKNVI